MSKFYYVSACPGSGKTTWAIKQLALKYLQSGCNVLMVVPTIDLCDQIVRDSGGCFKTYHTENTRNVIAAIQDIFKARRNGCPLVITEVGFNTVAGRVVGDNWVVIKDEATEPLQINTIRCPDSRDVLRSWLNLESVVSDRGHRTIFKAVSVRDDAPTTTTVDDDITGELHRLKELVRNPHLEVLVDDSRMEWVKPQLTYSVFTKPSLYSGFDRVYFMSANFEHTYLYHQWKHSGVEWVNVTPAALQGNYDSSRVRLHYWSECGAWSRARREKTGQLRQYVEWVNGQLPNGDYIYVLNGSDEELVEYKSLKGERIPAVCHGLNKWRHVTKFVSFASYLISGHEEPFYQHYGCSATDSRVLRNSQMIYQQLTRTDLRNKSSANIIDVYLPTLSEVRELLPYVPQAVIVDYSKKYNGEMTGLSAHLRHDWRCEQSNEMSLCDLQPSYALGANTRALMATCITGEELLEASLGLSHEESYLRENDPPNNILPPSFSRSKKQVTSRKQWRSDRPINPLIAFLKYCPQLSTSGATTPEEIKTLKRDHLEFFITGIVISGARFTKDSVIGNNDVIAFDFDGTELDLRDLSRIFNGFEYLRYTTISHDPSSNEGRYRVVLPTNRTMSISEHTRLMNYWRKEIEEYSKKHNRRCGLDEKCLGPERKFYVPHMESDIKHIYENKKVMDIDAVLSRIPKPPLVTVPAVGDIEFLASINGEVPANKTLERIHGIIDTMSAGDRSSKAVRIGGIVGRSRLSRSEREAVYNMMRQRGVSSDAVNWAKRYGKEY